MEKDDGKIITNSRDWYYESTKSRRRDIETGKRKPHNQESEAIVKMISDKVIMRRKKVVSIIWQKKKRASHSIKRCPKKGWQVRERSDD
jgi:hypothetical protein